MKNMENVMVKATDEFMVKMNATNLIILEDDDDDDPCRTVVFSAVIYDIVKNENNTTGKVDLNGKEFEVGRRHWLDELSDSDKERIGISSDWWVVPVEE